MNKMPTPDKTVQAIYEHYEATQTDSRRPHLGSSLIGEECKRKLWYIFRWISQQHHDGRLLRLFDTGNHAEPRFVKDLRDIGVTVHEHDESGNQWKVWADFGHFGGSMDGAGVGFIEAPKTWHVIEFKTHGEKSFKDLKKKGVLDSKPQHYAQMQVYMGLTKMDRAFYLAVNKNTDDLYQERIYFDKEYFAQIMDKAHDVVFAETPPEKAYHDESFYLCKWCDFSGACWQGDLPQRNCRTCMHSTPQYGGTWQCEKMNATISDNDQKRMPCLNNGHRYIPELIQLEQLDVHGEDIIYANGFIDNGTGNKC